MKVCPDCRRKLARPDPTCPHCGCDLIGASAELATLMQPPTGAVVLPFDVLKGMSKAGRRRVSAAIHQTRRAP